MHWQKERGTKRGETSKARTERERRMTKKEQKRGKGEEGRERAEDSGGEKDKIYAEGKWGEGRGGGRKAQTAI